MSITITFGGYNAPAPITGDMSSPGANALPVFAPLPSGGFVTVTGGRIYLYDSNYVLMRSITAPLASPAVASLIDGGFVVTSDEGTVIRYDAAGIQGAYTLRSGGAFSEVVGLADGGYATVGLRTGAITIEIFSAGDVSTGTFTAAGDIINPYYPDIIQLTNGDLVVTWMDFNQGDGNILAQQFDGGGSHAARGPAFLVAGTSDAEYLPQVTALAGGGYAVLYAAFTDNWNIFARIYDASGAPTGPAFQVNAYTAGDQRYNSIAATADGGFIAVWTSNGQDGDAFGVYGQRVGGDGTLKGPEFRAFVATVGDQYVNTAGLGGPALAVLSNGQLVIGGGGDVTLTRIFELSDSFEGYVGGAAIPLPITLSVDGGSQVAYVTLSGMPDGSTLSAGFDLSAGAWLLMPGELAGLTFTPPAGYAGTFNLTVWAHDGLGLTASANHNVVVFDNGLQFTPPDVAPVAAEDQVTVAENATAVAATRAEGVLANDTDGNAGQAATLVVTSVAAAMQAPVALAGTSATVTGLYGVLTINPDGTYSYEASGAESLKVGASALERFTYTVVDEDGLSSSAYLSFTVTGTNDGPTGVALLATPISNPVIVENAVNQELGNLSVLDLDAGDGVTFVLVDENDNALVGGPFSLLGSILSASGVDYEAGATLILRVKATDTAGASVTQLLTLSVSNVNEAPVAVADSVQATEGQNLALMLLNNDSDPDGDTLTISGIGGINFGAGSTVTTADGVYTLNLLRTAVFFTPSAAYASLNVGETAVIDTTYSLSDGTLTSSASLAITVNGAANAVAGATSGIDKLTGGAFDDLLQGLGGADVLTGGGGNDRLDGGVGIDRMVGGSGNDTYVVDDIRDVVVELGGEGIDAVESSVDLTLGANIENLNFTGTAIKGTGNALNNTLTGNGQNNVLNGADGDDIIVGLGGHDNLTGGNGADQIAGGDGNDTLTGATGNDTLVGGDGDDVMSGGDGHDLGYGGDGADQFLGGAGNDSVYAGEGADLAYGGAGDDQLHGDSGNDRLLGEAGYDMLFGDEGNDVLTGGQGADSLFGGLGADTFVYLSIGDSTSVEKDGIQDFNVFEGDRINLQAIDAKSGTAANDDFTLVANLTGVAGQLAISRIGSGFYLLSGDVDGDGQADFELFFATATPLTVSDLSAITGVKTISLSAIPDLFV